MSSKYTEAFDSLKSDNETKRERTERILSVQSSDENIVQTGSGTAAKARKHIFTGKRGTAIIVATVILFAVAISIPAGIILRNCRGLLGAMSMLKNTFVEMDGVAAFGVWNAPDNASDTARVTDISYVRSCSYSLTDGENDIITGYWDDDERYDWESDYDWDPTKANVLITIGDDGNISEVVYERTNGRGQVRQDVLGNAAAVYVSNGFTYVMYVDDDEWEHWKSGWFAQEMYLPNGFHCHHESMQTVVIHNATGKVFALNDLIPQVNELSGAINYTMQVHPFKDNFLYVAPMYGNYIPQWYNVIYDEQEQKIRYELVLPPDSKAIESYDTRYHVRAVRKDKYGQQYLLEGVDTIIWTDESKLRGEAGIVNLPLYTRYGNSIIFSSENGTMLGTDGRMYAFDEGKLKVFGENFELHTVEPDTEIALEGIADDFSFGHSGIAYKLKDGYLYSMFGEVWKVNGDGALHALERLKGSFPRFSDDALLIDGEIIAFVNTEQTADGRYSINGQIVRIRFDCKGGTPSAIIEHIIDASEIITLKHRFVAEQNENPYTSARGDTKYYLITVEGGVPHADYFAYGCDGGIYGLTRPITQPLMLS